MINIKGNIIAFIGQKGIPKEFPGTSGVESYTEQKALEYLRYGNTVRCYVRRWANDNQLETYRGIRLVTLPTINHKFFDTMSHSLLASVHASLSDATIVWYQGIGPAFFSFIPKLFHKHVYTTVHSLDWKRKKWGVLAREFLYVCERLAVLFSEKIFIVSYQLQDYYSFTYHILPILDKYRIPKQINVSLKLTGRKYQLKKNKYVLYLGRFVPEKKIEWLIMAYRKINPKNIKLVLAGGSSYTDKYEKMIRGLTINDKRLTTNIIFTGYIFGRQKAELISNCLLFILPSELEGYPISVVEAMGYDKKCLVADFLKAEFPKNNHLLYYFRRNNFSDFYNKLKQLIS